MRDAKKGTYNGQHTYCPVNGWDCPYCDKNLVCHIDNPCEDCDDWSFFFPTWQDWENVDHIEDETTDFAEEEIAWAREYMGYEENEDYLEMGFDPYSGCYTDDC